MSASAPSSVHSAETKREGAVRSSNIEEGGMVDALEKAPMPAAATSDAVDDTGSISTKEAGRSAGHHSPDEQQQLEGARLAIVFGALLLSIFLIAIDQTILAVALPSIGSDFNSFSLQGWVASAFVLTQSATILLVGQLLRVVTAKHMMLLGIVLFELGSVVCGSAHTITILIFGRALCGVGASGIFGAGIQTLTQFVEIRRRAKLMGLFGAVFGIASIVGPLLGGAFTENSKLTWRWCFYINLPIGGVSFAVVLFALKAVPPLGCDLTDRSFKNIMLRIARADWFGSALCLGSLTSLSLAFNWAGTRGWGNYTVIVPLVMAVVGLAIFWAWERWLDERSMVPSAIFRSWSVICILVFNFWVRFVLLIITYYVPLWYQAARGDTPVKSGINLLAYMLGVVISVIASGQIVARVGRYWPFLFFGPMFLCVGAGLLYTLTANTTGAKVIGYQILCGVGTGSTMQLGFFAIQAELHNTPRLIAQAVGMSSFAQFLGGDVGLGVGSAIFTSELTKYLSRLPPSIPDTAKMVAVQAPSSIKDLPVEIRQPIIDSIVKALRVNYIFCVPLAGLMMLSALGIKNVNIKTLTPMTGGPGAAPAAKDSKEKDVEKRQDASDDA